MRASVILFRALAALAVLALPGAASAARARLVPELALQAGGGSDLVIGAGFGPHAQAAISPGLRADLSTGPVVKLHGRYGFSYARYGLDADGTVHELDAVLRLRLGRAADLDLAGAGTFLAFSEAVPESPGLPATTRSRAVETGPRLRVRLPAEARLDLGATLHFRESETGAGVLPERGSSLRAGYTQRFGARLELGAAFDHVTTRADLPESTYDGDGGALVASLAPAGALVLRTRASVHWNRFPAAPLARTDRFAELLISASHPLAGGVELELAASLADNASPEPLYDGQRALGLVILRWEAPWEP